MSKMTKEQINDYLLQYLEDNSKNYNDTIQELSDTIRSYYDRLEKQKKEQAAAVEKARRDLSFEVVDYLEVLTGEELSDSEYKKLVKEALITIKNIEPDIKQLVKLSKMIGNEDNKRKEDAGTDDEILKKFFGNLK